MASSDYLILTRDLLMQGAGRTGKHTTRQVEVFGELMSPGYLDRLVGKRVPKKAYKHFLSLGEWQRKPTKAIKVLLGRDPAESRPKKRQDGRVRLKRYLGNWTYTDACPFCKGMGPHKTEYVPSIRSYRADCAHCGRHVKPLSPSVYFATQEKEAHARQLQELREINTGKYVVLTESMIRDGLEDRRRLIHPEQLNLLGTDGKAGWLKKTVGKRILKKDYEQFVKLCYEQPEDQPCCFECGLVGTVGEDGLCENCALTTEHEGSELW